MKLRIVSVALIVALLGAFLVAPFSTASAATKDKNFLKNVPVTGTLADGGTFKGQVSITQFGYDPNTGLWVSGRLIGTATKADGTTYENINQSFSQVHASLTKGTSGLSAASIGAMATCNILNLDIGAIHLDLLGLVVDLSPIQLNITAVSGPGNLLGNLLCAVAGLLDQNGLLNTLLGDITQLLNQLTGLLNQINQII